jgi:hypothetical protein
MQNNMTPDLRLPNLLEVSVGVVHDGEVLLVDVELVQGEGDVGETKPEPVVDRNLGTHSLLIKKSSRAESEPWIFSIFFSYFLSLYC